MQKLQLSGKVHSVSEVNFIGQNNTKVQRLRLDCTDNPEYPNIPEFQAIGKNVSLLASLKTGETIQIGFVIDGRDYEKDGKRGVITNLNILEIGRLRTDFIKVEDEPETKEMPAPAAATGPAKNDDIIF
jgi:hypothetical protein